MNEPVAYLMVERNDGNSYIQMGVPTRDEKISHHPYPLYIHQANESFDRTASHMAGEYISYNEPVAWGMLDKDGGIYDSISPEEHDREEGAYTIPLYTHASEHDLEIAEAIGFDKGYKAATAKTLTDEEIWKLWVKHLNDDIIVFARAILRKAQE